MKFTQSVLGNDFSAGARARREPRIRAIARERAPQRHGSYRQAQPPRQGVSRDVRVRSVRGPDRVVNRTVVRTSRGPVAFRGGPGYARRDYVRSAATCGRIRRAATTGRAVPAYAVPRHYEQRRRGGVYRRADAITGPLPACTIARITAIRRGSPSGTAAGAIRTASPAIPTCIPASTATARMGSSVRSVWLRSVLRQQRLRGGSGRHPPADESEGGAGVRRRLLRRCRRRLRRHVAAAGAGGGAAQDRNHRARASSRSRSR